MAERAREQSGPPGSRRGVALLLLTAPDRQSLLDKIDDLLARPEASLQSSGATPLQGARLAIAAPPQELRARLEIARSRLAGLARARLTLRTSGIDQPT